MSLDQGTLQKLDILRDRVEKFHAKETARLQAEQQFLQNVLDKSLGGCHAVKKSQDAELAAALSGVIS